MGEACRDVRRGSTAPHACRETSAPTETRAMRSLLLTATFLALIPLLAAREDADPLPSWNDGVAKKAVVKFVKEATDRKSKDHVPPRNASPRSTTTGPCGASSRPSR